VYGTIHKLEDPDMLNENRMSILTVYECIVCFPKLRFQSGADQGGSEG
jgi:hypothetical protein